MYNLKAIEERMSQISEDKLITLISKGSLKLTDEQIDTLSFVFWLCFLAEKDLGDSLEAAWKKATETSEHEAIDEAKRLLEESIFGGKKSNKPLEDILKDLPVATAVEIRSAVEKNYFLKRQRGVGRYPEYQTPCRFRYTG